MCVCVFVLEHLGERCTASLHGYTVQGTLISILEDSIVLNTHTGHGTLAGTDIRELEVHEDEDPAILLRVKDAGIFRWHP